MTYAGAHRAPRATPVRDFIHQAAAGIAELLRKLRTHQRPDGPASVPAADDRTAQAAAPEPPSLHPGRPSENKVMPDSAFTRPDHTGLTQVATWRDGPTAGQQRDGLLALAAISDRQRAPWGPAEQPSAPPERDTTTFPKIPVDGQLGRRYANPPMHRDPNMLVRSFESAVRAR